MTSEIVHPPAPVSGFTALALAARVLGLPADAAGLAH